VVSSAASIILTETRNLREAREPTSVGPTAGVAAQSTPSAACEPFLRIPPFPGARCREFARLQSAASEPAAVAAKLRHLRVGGTYWASQPPLPDRYVLLRSPEALGEVHRISRDPVVLWTANGTRTELRSNDAAVTGECDPWHMLASASAVVAEPGDELRLIAALLDVPCYDFDRTTGEAALTKLDAEQLVEDAFHETAFENPFTGESMDALEAVELCGFWRALIDSNREVAGGLGFAFWKQDNVAPLLWDGSRPFAFLRGSSNIGHGASVAVWRVKAAPEPLADLESRDVKLIEVEDGFLRSSGLGADCVPPLSITVDHLGPYFDPAQRSDLERLLAEGDFDEPLVDRARELRRVIVDAGIGKYERGVEILDRPAGDRRHILVPGQVEDDRAVQAGGCGLTSNLELLKRVREQAPDAYILYKPHPDVLAGHRRGSIPESICLRFADEIVGDLPIASLLAMVDEVHVNTSLTGFEALLRGKLVTTYGVPFYAGWGLTRDLGPVPSRRGPARTIDELVAATLLLYPRYLDPVTGLPCPAEVVVARLTACEERNGGLVVGMRRLQGKLMRRLRSLVQ
jgi:capsular polysaccharide export protein